MNDFFTCSFCQSPGCVLKAVVLELIGLFLSLSRFPGLAPEKINIVVQYSVRAAVGLTRGATISFPINFTPYALMVAILLPSLFV